MEFKDPLDLDFVHQKRGINNLKHNDYYKIMPGFSGPHDDIIPVWIADMDFIICKSLQDSQISIFEENDFSAQHLEKLENQAKQATQDWLVSKHDFDRETIKLEYMTMCHGTIQGFVTSLLTITKEGEGIVILAPNYYQMQVQGKSCGRIFKSCDLIVDDNGRYQIDFKYLDTCLADEKMKGLIIMNPHNPTGRLWQNSDFEQILALLEKHDKILISDNVFIDLAYNEFNSEYKCCPQYSQRFMTVVGPTKSFNASGTQGSLSIIPNPELRQKFRQLQNALGYTPSIQALKGYIGAYTPEGRKWVESVTKYISENYKFLKEELKEIDEVHLRQQEGGYLVLFCHPEIPYPEMLNILVGQKVVTQSIANFYEPHRETRTFRINVAVQRSVLEKVVARIKEGIKNYRQNKNSSGISPILEKGK